jgi:hypothetical protein
MCQRIHCKTCGKPTWAGCGAHVEQALRGVPVDLRCQCRERKPAVASPTPAAGFWKRLVR